MQVTEEDITRAQKKKKQKLLGRIALGAFAGFYRWAKKSPARERWVQASWVGNRGNV